MLNGALSNENNMAQLHIEIEAQTLKDFDDADYSVKYADATIDDVYASFDGTFETSMSDADIKTAVRAKLTEKGYVWDSEV